MIVCLRLTSLTFQIISLHYQTDGKCFTAFVSSYLRWQHKNNLLTTCVLSNKQFDHGTSVEQ